MLASYIFTSMPPAVSIILPVHNAAKHLQETLATITGQTYTNWELICVENGSTDASADILKRLAALDSRVKVFCRGPIGAGAARNEGLERACGKYVCFCDADDLYAPSMLQLLTEAAENHQADLVLCAAQDFKDTADVNQRVFTPDRYVLAPNLLAKLPQQGGFNPCEVLGEDVSLLTSGAPWAKLIRTDHIRKHNLRFAQTAYSEDVPFTYRALILAQRAVAIPTPLVSYRVSNHSLSFSKKDEYRAEPDAWTNLIKQLRNDGAPTCAIRSVKKRLPSDLMWHVTNLTAKGKLKFRICYASDYEPLFGLLMPEAPHTHGQMVLRRFCRPRLRFIVEHIPSAELLEPWLQSFRNQLYPDYEVWCTAALHDTETEQRLEAEAYENRHFFRILPEALSATLAACEDKPITMRLPEGEMLHSFSAWRAAHGETRSQRLFRHQTTRASHFCEELPNMLRFPIFGTGKAWATLTYIEPDTLCFRVLGRHLLSYHKPTSV